jgi:type VI secretion system protein ImpA
MNGFTHLSHSHQMIMMDKKQWDALLAPLEGARPCGKDLRYEGTYDRIRQARREDDPALDQGIWQRGLKKADWDLVHHVCVQALASQSKDLTLAVWLLEAWLHVFGFAGVSRGLQLILDLSERYWDDMFPSWEKLNPESRLAPFTWINEKLSLEVKKISLCLRDPGEDVMYSWADWEQALRIEQEGKRNPDLLESRIASGAITRETFLQRVEATPVNVYSALSDECRNILGICENIDRVLDQTCGKLAPGLTAFKESIHAILGFASNVNRERQEKVELRAVPAADAVRREDDGEAVSPGLSPNGCCPIESREEAYARLLEAADYLHRHEPHSPTPYLVKRAVSWGRMTLSEVVEDLDRSDMGRGGFYALLGFSRPAASSRAHRE